MRARDHTFGCVSQLDCVGKELFVKNVVTSEVIFKLFEATNVVEWLNRDI